MAAVNYPKFINGEKITVLVAFDGTNYAHPAMINTSRGITQTVSTSDAQIADMGNPSDISKTVRTSVAQDMQISGAGILDIDSFKQWSNWASNGVSVATRIIVDAAGSGSVANAITYQGNSILTSLELTGTKGDKPTVNLTLQQADKFTIT